MMITGKERDEQIDKLALSMALLKLTRGEYVHPDLEFRCESIKYSLEPEDFSPNGLDVVPLWECEFSITGFHLQENKPVFITYDLDEIDLPKVIGSSVVDLVQYLVTEFGENETELRSALSL